MPDNTEIQRLFDQNSNLFARMSEAERLLAVQGEKDRRTELDIGKALEKLEEIGADVQLIKAKLETKGPGKGKGGPWGMIMDLFSRWTPAAAIVFVLIALAAAYMFFEEPLSEVIAASKQPAVESHDHGLP